MFARPRHQPQSTTGNTRQRGVQPCKPCLRTKTSLEQLLAAHEKRELGRRVHFDDSDIVDDTTRIPFALPAAAATAATDDEDDDDNGGAGDEKKSLARGAR